MIGWNEIKGKIESISIVETFEKHLDTPKQTAINAHIKQVRDIHRGCFGLLERIPGLQCLYLMSLSKQFYTYFS